MWRPRASPRRFGRGWPKPGAIETTTACSPPGVASSNSRRSATVLWWMWPARTRSAPASTSPARTRFRFATGFLRERHGAPSRWWWSVTIRYAPVRDLPEDLRGAPHLLVAQAARLVPPRPDGVEPGDDERVRAVHRLGRLPQPLELLPGPGEPPRKRVRDVVVARDRQQRQLEAAEEGRRPLVLAAQPSVGQIAARDHEVGSRFLDQPAERLDRLRPVVSAEMQVGKVENTCRHSRLRLYSPCTWRPNLSLPRSSTTSTSG